MLLYLLHHLLVRWITPGHLPHQIHIKSHSDVNLCPVFYLKACLCCTEWALMEEVRCISYCSLLLGNNIQHIPMCAKHFFFSWEHFEHCKGTYASHYPLWCCVVCSLGGWCFSGVHPTGRRLCRTFYASQILFLFLHHFYRLAPGLHSVGCPWFQWVVSLFVSVKHWPISSLANMLGC